MSPTHNVTALDGEPREHPKDRPPEPDDPMEVMAAASPGQASFMLSCLVEEFARMGTPREEILRLFTDPFYRATHGLADVLGPGEVERRVDAILGSYGVHGARSSVADDLEEV